MKRIYTLFILAALFSNYQVHAQCPPDTEPPEVVAKSGFGVNILPTGNILLWSSDFVDTVQDNCTPENDIKISLRIAGTCVGFPLAPDGSLIDYLVFSCNDLGTQLIEVWARDAAGNVSMDETYIIVQDNIGFCGSGSGNALVCAKTELDIPIEKIRWHFKDLIDTMPIPVNWTLGMCMTSFYVYPPYSPQLLVTPRHDQDYLNGVSTLDLFLINRHILGNELLDSPYKILAADANNSGSVTISDIVELRKLILGKFPELPKSDSWGFVPESFVFPDPENPFQTAVPHAIVFDNSQWPPVGTEDFIGYKIGDVNGNATPCHYFQATEDRSSIALNLPDVFLLAGESVQIPLRLNTAFETSGLQFSLKYDPALLEISTIRLSERLTLSQPLTSADEFYAIPEPGLFNFSWNNSQATEILEGETLVFLEITAFQPTTLSKVLQLNTRRLQPELYTPDGKIQGLDLQFSATPKPEQTQIFPAAPNPSNGPVFIPIALAENTAVTLEIFDLNGRQIFRQKQTLPAGFQQLEILPNVLHEKGKVLIYRIQAGIMSDSGKLIRF